MQRGSRRLDQIERMFEQRKRVDFQFDQAADVIESIAEDEAGPLQRAEQVAEQRKAAADGIGEEQRRAPSLIDASLQRADFQVGIERHIDTEQLAAPLKIDNTFLQIFVAHGVKPVVKRCLNMGKLPLNSMKYNQDSPQSRAPTSSVHENHERHEKKP